MRIIKCDKCRNVIPQDEALQQSFVGNETYDLCQTCVTRFVKWLGKAIEPDDDIV